MELNDWLNKEVLGIVDELEVINKENLYINRNLGLRDKNQVFKILKDLRSALFPGIYDDGPLNESNPFIIGEKINSSALQLRNQIEKLLLSSSEYYYGDITRTRDKANQSVIELIKYLPKIRSTLQTDIEAAFNGDPSAKSIEEIILTYPSIEAISIYRIANKLYELNIPVIPRILSEHAHKLTGIDIHPGAKIGESFFVDHGTGVVIGETCTIGSGVKIYQGVTLGAKSFPIDEKGEIIKGIKRHPTVEDEVIIYAGTTILGGKTVIGHNSIIGGNVWLTDSVLPYSRVYNGKTSPIIKYEKIRI